MRRNIMLTTACMLAVLITSAAPGNPTSQSTPEQTVERDWSRQEKLKQRAPGCREAVSDVLQRGEALLKDLAELGADEVVSQAAEKLAACRRRHDELAAREETDSDVAAEWDELYLRTRWIVRRAALNNPLLDFDELLFVKRFTPSVAHQCSHHVGSSQVPGGDLCVLSGLKPDGKVRSVLGDLLPSGAIGRPDLSFDARQIVFPYAAPRPNPTAYPHGLPGQVGGACLDYQLYEINVGSEGDSGTGLRKLTTGPHENTSKVYFDINNPLRYSWEKPPKKNKPQTKKEFKELYGSTPVVMQDGSLGTLEEYAEVDRRNKCSTLTR